jgi:hypothetical protein
MLPLTAVGGSPRSLCLCSTGELKRLCDSDSVGPERQATAAPLIARAPHRSCCHRSDSSQTSRCEAAACHCTPLVALPDASAKVEPSSAPVADLASDLVRIAERSRAAGELERTACRATASCDLLYLLSRLII